MTTLERLKAKSEAFVGIGVRMPSIRQISKLLTEHGIEHEVDEHTNIVEYSSKGRRYVNSRHEGKTGLRLRIKEENIELDTSDSYYSWNTWSYARKIVELIERKQNKP